MVPNEDLFKESEIFRTIDEKLLRVQVAVKKFEAKLSA
jgi:hypothetical protein